MKAFLLSLEAIIAVSLLFVIAVFLSGIVTNPAPELKYERLYLSAKDVLNILENAKISEAKNLPTLQNYVDTGVIQNTDGTLLDAIGFLWAAGNITEASALTQEIMETVFNGTNFNYQLLMDDTLIHEFNTSDGEFIARLSTVVSGYDIGKPVEGFISRAYVTHPAKQDRIFSFFGGYVGDGNVSTLLQLPDLETVLDAELELDAGNNFSLYVNGNFSGSYSKSIYGNLSSETWTVPSQYLDNFVPGENLMMFNFTTLENNYIGGGKVKVVFNTTELIVQSETSYGENTTGNHSFPGINGIINLFDSFYVPGNVTNLSLYLEYLSFYPVFFVIGNQTIFTSNETSMQTITLNDSNLSGLLDYQTLSERTVPIRFGTENLTLLGGGLGALDTSLITDRTGSMTACDVVANCNESNLCDSNPSGGCHANRHLVAVEADKSFVDVITSTEGNNVGLIGYGERAAPTCGFAEISNDNATLQATVDDYNYNDIWQECGWTCISCGIEAATVQLTEFEKLWAASKTSAVNTTPIHVGDTGPVAVNITFTMSVNISNFIKGRIIILGTNTDVADGYQDCVFLNNNYLGRICESDGSSETSWHTCTYPVKSEWIIDGDNDITITGGNVNGCFDEAGEQDDWDFKSVEFSIWETVNNSPTTSVLFQDPSQGLNGHSIPYSSYADLWELSVDLPYPVDFTSGYNTTANTFGIGGANDGWDWDTEDGSGVYGFDDDVDYNGVVNEMLELDMRQGTSNVCGGDDCSGAYGIEIEVTQEQYDAIQNGSQAYVSFWYEWDGNDNPFENSDQVWIKGRWESPTSGSHWLGSNLDSGDSGSDGDPEIATANNPDNDFTGAFSQEISAWVEGPGFYYLDFGGKLRASASNEWGHFRFDDIAMGIGTNPCPGSECNLSFTIENTTTLKAASIEFEAEGIDLNAYDCLYLNNNLVGRIDEQKWNGTNVWQTILFDLPVAWISNNENNITFTGGTEDGCRRVGTNDGWQYRNVSLTFTYTNETRDYDRTKAMLIMSDGEANTKIGDCRNYGSGGCTSVGLTPSQETVNKACEAHNQHDITIYAVAFGDPGQTAIDTLNDSAGCDSYDNFFTSNDKDELINIYRAIAQDLVNISFVAQSVILGGNVSLNNSLSPRSMIQYDYISSVPNADFGEVSFTFESLPFRNLTGDDIITDNITGTKDGWFFVPPTTAVIDARITSYSSQFWTDRMYAKAENGTNFTRVYWLDEYNTPYENLGDPYNVHIPAGLLTEGNNSVKIGTGLAATNATGGSPDSRVIYTIRFPSLNLEGYSGVFPKQEGATVTVYVDLTGDDVHDIEQVISYGPNPADFFDPYNDSIDDAFMRLMDNFNILFDDNVGSYGDGSAGDPYDGLNDTNPIEFELSEDLTIDSTSVTGITSLWGPATLTINVWV